MVADPACRLPVDIANRALDSRLWPTLEASVPPEEKPEGGTRALDDWKAPAIAGYGDGAFRPAKLSLLEESDSIR